MSELNVECEICHEVFSGNITLHLLSHTEEKVSECNICSRLFSLKEKFGLHLVTHINAQSFDCELCRKMLTLKNHLKWHKSGLVKSHASCASEISESTMSKDTDGKKKGSINKEVPMYECNKCLKHFNLKCDFDKHMVIHTKEKTHECEICHKLFSERGIKRHKISHRKPKSVKCEICHKLFSFKVNLKLHMLKHLKKQKCVVCRKPITSGDNMTMHLLCHVETMAHECEICQKLFMLKENIADHISTHGNYSSCKLCVKFQPITSHLKTHKFPFLKKNSHQCEICDKCFSQHCDLKKHAITHLEVKPHTCEICSKSFASKRNLHKHCLIHTEEKNT